MSNINTASGTQLTFIGGGSRKFYRVFVLGDTEIRQWGRVGSNGQFKRIVHGGVRAAEASAEKQAEAKMRKGYGSRIDHTFAFDYDLLRKPGSDKMVAAAFEAAEAIALNPAHEPDELDELLGIDRRGGTAVLTAAPTLEQINTRALEVVVLASTAVEDAAIQYAQLRDDYSAVAEQVERAESLMETIEAML